MTTPLSAANPAAMPQPGDVVADRYTIEGELGRGGFAVVFRARDERTGASVALKVLDPTLATQESFVQRFGREVQTVARLTHPNTVRVFDTGMTTSGAPWLTMELLRGTALDDALRTQGPLPPSRVWRILMQVCKSLAEAHAAGIVHRDIKPANLFLVDLPGERDFIKVLDFGIARSLHANGNGLTTTGELVCSPQYVAPERLTEDLTVPAGDLYSLGITAIELLEGRPPIAAATPIALAMRHANLDELVPMAPQTADGGLGPVLRRATAKTLDERYRTALEMLADLEALEVEAGFQGSALDTPAAGRPRMDRPSATGASASVTPPSGPITGRRFVSASSRAAMATAQTEVLPTPPSSPTPLVEDTWEPPPRSRWPVVLGVLLALGGLVGGGWVAKDQLARLAGVPAPASWAPAACSADEACPGMTCVQGSCAPAGTVWVPPGAFQQGSPPTEPGRGIDEELHGVTLTTGFWMDQHETTQAAWSATVAARSEAGATPSRFADCADGTCPVERVNWYEAVWYANVRSGLDGLAACYRLVDCEGTPGGGCRPEAMSCVGDFRCLDVQPIAGCSGWRLPTSAEWEYAYRAGTQTAYPHGHAAAPGTGCEDARLAQRAWFCGNADGRTWPVGQKEPNPWGLMDLGGNVWEWVWDAYGAYPGRDVVDPQGAEATKKRMLRGGGGASPVEALRAARRSSDNAAQRNAAVGFRLVRNGEREARAQP